MVEYGGDIPEKNILAFDVGGTQIKSCLISKNGDICSEITVKDANAYGSLSQILHTFKERIGAYDLHSLCGIGFGFPGPFDYENGISLMKGVGVRQGGGSQAGKYDALYDFEFGKWVKQTFSLPVRFCNDADLFGLGEYHLTLQSRYKKVLAVCIGIGFGSSVIENGEKLSRIPGISETGWLYAVPFRNGIADDYLSAAGLERMIRKAGYYAANGKELYADALSGNIAAKRIFEEFGGIFTEFMLPMLQQINPDAVVIGGQVAGSFDIWGKTLLDQIPLPKEDLFIDCDSTKTAMRAVSLLFKK